MTTCNDTQDQDGIDGATARALVALINQFDRKSRAAQYTDTDEAWGLLQHIRARLRPRRRERTPRILTQTTL